MSTQLRIGCPRCKAVLIAGEEVAGEQRPCPSCGQLINLPTIGAFAAAEAASRTAPPPPPALPPARLQFAQRIALLPLYKRILLLVVAIGLPVGVALGVTAILAQRQPVTRPEVRASDAERREAGEQLLRLAEAQNDADRAAASEWLTQHRLASEAQVLRTVSTGRLTRDEHPVLLEQHTAAILLDVLTGWAKVSPLPADATTLGQTLLAGVHARQAAILLCFQRDAAGVPLLVDELTRRLRRIDLATQLVKRALVSEPELGVVISREQQAVLELRTALAAVGPAAWRPLLQRYWDMWILLASPQAEPYLAELDAIRLAGDGASRAVDELMTDPEARVALAASIYVERIRKPSFDTRLDLAGAIAPLVADADATTRQRAVWAICRMTGQQFAGFDDKFLPAQADDAAIRACRSWVEATYVRAGQ